MPRESREQLKKRVGKIMRILANAYPDADCHLNYSNPLEISVATILAARCTDAKVNEVTASLFKKYQKAGDYAKASQSALEKQIRPTGFYRNKAERLRNFASAIVEKHGGNIPDTMEELTALPGIGRKSANIILSCVFDKPGIIVDTHVRRVAPRLGLTMEKDAVKIEADLDELVPVRQRADFSFRLADHGRAVCHPRRPECGACPLKDLCPGADAFG
ncbi:MAG: endonuclease III [Planctomycetota bacterium]|nr:MAG: endonuclease III [Planctomycetota bacterium]